MALHPRAGADSVMRRVFSNSDIGRAAIWQSEDSRLSQNLSFVGRVEKNASPGFHLLGGYVPDLFYGDRVLLRVLCQLAEQEQES